MNESLKKRSVTIAEATKLLKNNGLQLDEKDVEIILDFLYFLAKLTVNQYINSQDSNPV
jgi:hypothetical protein